MTLADDETNTKLMMSRGQLWVGGRHLDGGRAQCGLGGHQGEGGRQGILELVSCDHVGDNICC